MDAEQLQKFLEENEACESARRWATGKSLREAWEQCSECHWLVWLRVTLDRSFDCKSFYKAMREAGFRVLEKPETERADYVRRQIPFSVIEAAILSHRYTPEEGYVI